MNCQREDAAFFRKTYVTNHGTSPGEKVGMSGKLPHTLGLSAFAMNCPSVPGVVNFGKPPTRSSVSIFNVNVDGSRTRRISHLNRTSCAAPHAYAHLCNEPDRSSASLKMRWVVRVASTLPMNHLRERPTELLDAQGVETICRKPPMWVHYHGMTLRECPANERHRLGLFFAKVHIRPALQDTTIKAHLFRG